MALTAGAGNILTLIGMLLAVVGILFLAWFTTRWISRRGGPFFPSGSHNGGMRVLLQLSLGQNERLVLIQAGQRCLLLGVTAGGITLLLELDEAETASWLSDDSETPTPPSFWEAVQKNLPHRK